MGRPPGRRTDDLGRLRLASPAGDRRNRRRGFHGTHQAQATRPPPRPAGHGRRLEGRYARLGARSSTGRTSSGRRWSSSWALRREAGAGRRPSATAASNRASDTSRCRSPSSRASSYAARRRTHFICPAPRPRFLDQRGHLHVVEAARDDPAERLQVVLDVDREAVRGHTPGDVNPDRGDLAVVDPPPVYSGPSSGRARATTPSSASTATSTRSSNRT